MTERDIVQRLMVGYETMDKPIFKSAADEIIRLRRRLAEEEKVREALEGAIDTIGLLIAAERKAA